MNDATKFAAGGTPAHPLHARLAGGSRRWLLVALLVLVLFPFGWLGELWSRFGAVLGWLFPTASEHAIGHATLFCTLGVLALIIIPGLRVRPSLYFGLLLLVGVGQEFLQLLYKQRPPVLDDGRDLLNDLAGALVAFVIVGVWRWVRRSSELRVES